MERKNILFVAVTVVVAVSSAFFIYGLVSSNKAQVEISSIQKETLIYGGFNHQIFSGYVVNKGNVEAVNVRVFVNWIDMNNGDYEGFCDVGSVGVGESVQFNVDFSSNEIVMVSYYTQWVVFE